jgi:hypothetical protein
MQFALHFHVPAWQPLYVSARHKTRYEISTAGCQKEVIFLAVVSLIDSVTRVVELALVADWADVSLFWQEGNGRPARLYLSASCRLTNQRSAPDTQVRTAQFSPAWHPTEKKHPGNVFHHIAWEWSAVGCLCVSSHFACLLTFWVS